MARMSVLLGHSRAIVVTESYDEIFWETLVVFSLSAGGTMKGTAMELVQFSSKGCGGKVFEKTGSVIFECPGYIVLSQYPAADITIPRESIISIADTRTIDCPNNWHRSAPARARITCPECPESHPCANGQCTDPEAHAEGGHDI